MLVEWQDYSLYKTVVLTRSHTMSLTLTPRYMEHEILAALCDICEHAAWLVTHSCVYGSTR